jgi:hypothetical protein
MSQFQTQSRQDGADNIKDEEPLQLIGIKKKDFETFLTVIFPKQDRFIFPKIMI